jgi:hypothetical protein
MYNLYAALLGTSLGIAAGLWIVMFCPSLKNRIFNTFEWIAWKLIPGFVRQRW